MLRKYYLTFFLIFSLMFGFTVTNCYAATPDLKGIWIGTVNKINPLGCSSEVITLRILTQWGNLVGGDLNGAGSTIKWVGTISGPYNNTSFSLSSYSVYPGDYPELLAHFYATYDVNNPNEFIFSQLDIRQPKNETMNNTMYDTFTAVRQ